MRLSCLYIVICWVEEVCPFLRLTWRLLVLKITIQKFKFSSSKSRNGTLTQNKFSFDSNVKNMLYNNHYKYIKWPNIHYEDQPWLQIQQSLLTREVFITIVIDVLKLTNFSKKRLYQIIIKISIIIYHQHSLVAISGVAPNPCEKAITSGSPLAYQDSLLQSDQS